MGTTVGSVPLHPQKKKNSQCWIINHVLLQRRCSSRSYTFGWQPVARSVARSVASVDHGPHYTSLLLGNPYSAITFISLVTYVVRKNREHRQYSNGHTSPHGTTVYSGRQLLTLNHPRDVEPTLISVSLTLQLTTQIS